jgi:hypothetical protein
MAALSWSPLRMLCRPVPLRGLFVWLLLILLLTGAASYTHGSRYALVPAHSPFQSASKQGIESMPPESAASPAGTSARASQVLRVVEAGPSVEPGALEKECCEPRLAPRGEPAPVRTGAVDPLSLTHRDPGDRILSRVVPPEPDLSALTVVRLSISRT